MTKLMKEVWAYLDPDCMSGDKIDHSSQIKSKSKSKLSPSKRSIISKPVWRDDVKFEPFLRICDALYYSTRFDEDGRASAGRFPFEHVPSSRVDASSSLPKGLPLNLYNQAKIEEMKESGNLEVKMLGMRWPVALIFSKEILRYIYIYLFHTFTYHISLQNCGEVSSRKRPNFNSTPSRSTTVRHHRNRVCLCSPCYELSLAWFPAWASCQRRKSQGERNPRAK